MRAPAVALLSLSPFLAMTGSWARELRQADGPAPASFHDEEVTYPSGDVTLAGTLSIPQTKGPHAALVLITGSGNALRDQFGDWPHQYAAAGIATLVYDKRGCGASTGKFYDLLPIEDLAADALAGVAYLSSRPDIDANRIGLVTASQGGWVGPLVASRSRKISLMVLISPPMLSVAENGLYEVDGDLRTAGFSEAEIARSRQLNQLFNSVVLEGGAGWTRLRVALDMARGEQWFESARLPGPLPETPAPANLAWLERVRHYIAFDPMPLWQTLTIPVLALYGGKDVNVPAERSAEMLEQALKKAGNDRSTIKLFPNADHHLKVAPAGGQGPAESVPGLEEQIRHWLLEHFEVASQGALTCPHTPL